MSIRWTRSGADQFAVQELGGRPCAEDECDPAVVRPASERAEQHRPQGREPDAAGDVDEVGAFRAGQVPVGAEWAPHAEDDSRDRVVDRAASAPIAHTVWTRTRS